MHWPTIAERHPGRSGDGVQRLWIKYSGRQRRRKGEIDADMKLLVAKALESFLGETSELAREVSRLEWVSEEDDDIVKGIKLGLKWGNIASLLPSRTANGVRTRWRELREANPRLAKMKYEQ